MAYFVASRHFLHYFYCIFLASITLLLFAGFHISRANLPLGCNKIRHTVAKASASTVARKAAPSLYTASGERKYLNRDERRRIAESGKRLRRARRLFVLTLMWTGMRVSECLSLTPASFQLDSGVVSVMTLKRRKPVVREVPVPDTLLHEINREFDLANRQRNVRLACERLWPFSRWTAWRIVKEVMAEAGIFGDRACPRGFRHGFGVGVIHAGIPVTLLKLWFGHAKLDSTEIYLAVCGPEERELAQKFWSMV